MIFNRLFIFLLPTVLLVCISTNAQAQNATALYDEGMALLGQGKELKAQRKLDEALEQAQKSGDVKLQMKCHLELAELKSNVINYKTAIEHYRSFAQLYRKQTSLRTKQLTDSVNTLETEVITGHDKIIQTESEILQQSQQIDSLTTEQLQTKLDLSSLDLKHKDAEMRLHDASNAKRILWLVIGMVVLVLIFLGVEYVRKRKSNRLLTLKNEEILIEKAKSENLLLNILPHSVAAELKEHGKTSSARYESATVMFTDFKGFTSFAERTSPEQVVALLDFYFRAFDQIIHTYQIEKIKTIGDAYLCVSGVPIAHPDHASNMIKAAMELQQFMHQSKSAETPGSEYLQMRIGIHSGPIVAGVVGSKKFAYDIWGDTVNIAARFEQAGEIGRINVSETVVEAAKHQFTFEYRGELEAKNKGKMKMFFLKV